MQNVVQISRNTYSIRLGSCSRSCQNHLVHPRTAPDLEYLKSFSPIPEAEQIFYHFINSGLPTLLQKNPNNSGGTNKAAHRAKAHPGKKHVCVFIINGPRTEWRSIKKRSCETEESWRASAREKDPFLRVEDNNRWARK
jgi:hypothetical protein